MNMRKPIAVVAGARTPFAKAFTDLREVSAVELGRLATAGCAPQMRIVRF